MKSLISILLLITINSFSQDSIAVKIINKPFERGDTTWYKVKVYHMKGIENVWIWCCCKDKAKRKKGEMVIIAKQDLIFNKNE